VRRLKFLALGFMCALGLLVQPVAVKAADMEVQNVFEDTLYGAGIGAVVGGAFMLISGKPSQHWDYLMIGTGVGVLGGVVYGTVVNSRAFAQLDHGEVHMGVPVPQVALEESTQGTSYAVSMNVFGGRF